MTPHDLMIPPENPEAFVESTWHELGVQRYRAMNHRVIVRTWRIPEKIGSIRLPDRARSFYKGLPHSKLVRATVLAAPVGSGLKVGEAVCFPQTFFIRFQRLTDETLVGAVHTKYLHGRFLVEPPSEALSDAA